jgi:hypothetical protein
LIAATNFRPGAEPYEFIGGPNGGVGGVGGVGDGGGTGPGGECCSLNYIYKYVYLIIYI